MAEPPAAGTSATPPLPAATDPAPTPDPEPAEAGAPAAAAGGPPAAAAPAAPPPATPVDGPPAAPAPPAAPPPATPAPPATPPPAAATGQPERVAAAPAMPAHAPVPWRTILAAIAAAGGAYLAWLLVVALQRQITWLTVATFFAVVLSPPVDLLVRRARLRRSLAALIVFVVAFSVIGGLLYLFIRPIVTEVTRFAKQLPQLVKDAQAGRGPVGRLVQRYDLVNRAQEYAPKLQKYLSNSGSQALRILRRIGNGVVSALTILVLTFLLLVEGPRVLAGALGLLRPARQERLRRIGRSSSRAITGYVTGNLLISVIAAGVTYVGLWAFGVPFRGVLAVWVGFADLIPLVGATLGAIPTVGVAFLHSTAAGIGMIVIYVVYQQFENHVIQVTIMSRTVKLSPLAVLVSLLVGVQLFGLLGALLAIPVAAIIQVIGADILRERQLARGERPGPTPPPEGNGHPRASPPP